MNHQDPNKTVARSPWLFVPSLSFQYAFASAAPEGIALMMYKALGYSNEFVGYTSLLLIPLSITFLWAPWLDSRFRKRSLTINLGMALAICFAALAVAVYAIPEQAWLSLLLLLLVAVLGASYQVARSGVCLHLLSQPQLAGFSGVGTASIRIGLIFAGGLLISVCSGFGQMCGNPPLTWALVFGVLATLSLGLAFYHGLILPRPASDVSWAAEVHGEPGSIRLVLRQLCELPGSRLIILLLLICNFGEGLLVRMAVPFLLDPRASGGLGFLPSEVAFMYSTVGMVCTISGGLLGGWLIMRCGLRRIMLPTAIGMTFFHVGYLYLALALPSAVASYDLSPVLRAVGFAREWHFALNLRVQACIGVESFAYGLGSASAMYLIWLVGARVRLKAATSVLCGALSWIGLLVPYALSGVIQGHVGYFWLFVLSIVAGVPGILIIPFLPLHEWEETKLAT
jgi:PAT family beta-lactamase induction signal transducer AmpG